MLFRRSAHYLHVIFNVSSSEPVTGLLCNLSVNETPIVTERRRTHIECKQGRKQVNKQTKQTDKQTTECTVAEYWPLLSRSVTSPSNNELCVLW